MRDTCRSRGGRRPLHTHRSYRGYDLSLASDSTGAWSPFSCPYPRLLGEQSALEFAEITKAHINPTPKLTKCLSIKS